MSRRYQYFKGKKDKKSNIDKMKKYASKKQEMDKFLEKLIINFIKNKKLKILDACCGIGHIPYFLSSLSPESDFYGIDQTPYLIDESKKLCKNKKNIHFEVGDIYDLRKKYKKKFDISINWKTISWLPYYDQMLKSLVDVTKNQIFLSSLFYEGDIDFEIKVKAYQTEIGKTGYFGYYNVYSLPRFKDFVYSLGVKNIIVNDFELKIDLPKPPIDIMGTYTVNLANGKKLQISGTIVMPWKIIRIDL